MRSIRPNIDRNKADPHMKSVTVVPFVRVHPKNGNSCERRYVPMSPFATGDNSGTR
jgi:hypothetical protein